MGAFQRRQARALGVRGGKTAAVCFTRRFDSLLRIDPHFHAMVPEAVFVENGAGEVELRVLPRPTQQDLERIVRRIARRANRLLATRSEEAEPSDALDRLRGGQLELFAPAPKGERAAGKLTARVEGLSLQAATHLHANDRRGLERLCRYALRAPVAHSRLSRAQDGQVVVELKRALRDGRRQLKLSPMTLLQRLAGLVPWPRCT